MRTWWRLACFYRAGGSSWRRAMGRALDKVLDDPLSARPRLPRG